MAIMSSGFFAALAAAVSANAQSANPVAGINPKAQGANEDVTSNTGPNGYGLYKCEDEDNLILSQIRNWLNTGITSDGWNPPYMMPEEIYHISLDDF
jgi:hypothetical protein